MLLKNKLGDRLNNSQVLRNKSQVLKNKESTINEAQSIRNKDINAIKELDNKFTGNMRSMIDLLLQSVYKISGINKK